MTFEYQHPACLLGYSSVPGRLWVARKYFFSPLLSLLLREHICISRHPLYRGKKKKTFKAVCVFVCAKINWYTSAAVVTRGIRGKVLEKAWFFDLRATVFCPLDFQTVVNSHYQKNARHRVDKDSDVPAGKFPGRQQRLPFKNRGASKFCCFSGV